MTSLDQTPCPMEEQVDPSTTTIEAEIQKRKRAECMAHVQTYTVRLALDLLVREPDLKGFFRGFIKLLIDDGESDACGVFILDDESKHCELKMAYVDDRFYKIGEPGWETLNLPARDMSEHLFSFQPGWNETIEYAGDDARLPQSVRDFNKSTGVECLVVTPLALPTRNLGWIALSTAGHHVAEMGQWQRILLEAVALQVTLALHQKQLTQKSRDEERRKAILEERNRIARDIHDTLAQGFAAILMQLQSIRRWLPQVPPAAAESIETAVDLARSHMIEARRSVGALRPQDMETVDVAAVLERATELARRATDVPIELQIDQLPELGATVEREIIAIAQEALTNAVRHARARNIKVHASSTRNVGFRLSIADDGRGIAKERFGAGFGLTSMQERAERIGGSLTIVTAPRAGTEVVLAWEPPSFSIPTP
ncbi:MAG TPA: sensor histidine kinase [Thermoanaerobaculia bacterium]|nr:sensor histidine kinase [Thermoanaerobaculia bacterium]